eukprot:g39798.t1
MNSEAEPTFEGAGGMVEADGQTCRKSTGTMQPELSDAELLALELDLFCAECEHTARKQTLRSNSTELKTGIIRRRTGRTQQAEQHQRSRKTGVSGLDPSSEEGPFFLKKGPDLKRQLSCSSDAAWP